MNDVPLLTLPPPLVPQPRLHDKWRREYDAYIRMKAQLLADHAGKYVVVHDGNVVDSGDDEVALGLRFFSKYGNVPVHIGLVTPEPEPVERIPHYRELPAGAAG